VADSEIDFGSILALAWVNAVQANQYGNCSICITWFHKPMCTTKICVPWTLHPIASYTKM